MNSAQAVRGTRERKNKQNICSHTGPVGQVRGTMTETTNPQPVSAEIRETFCHSSQ